MRYSDMPPEEAMRSLDGKTPEEIIEIARSEGYALSDDELGRIRNDWGKSDDEYMNPTCPKCGTKHVQVLKGMTPHVISYMYCCLDCNHEWGVRVPR